ncbi:homeobox protein koza [Nematostella vectensis]|uniref:homeobox protein koza n=1 Tax=Nematostella vectensis TaxID=45351 RepID=UPI00207726D9|nr:homeobox protein koza [Nematostella vectensis]
MNEQTPASELPFSIRNILRDDFSSRRSSRYVQQITPLAAVGSSWFACRPYYYPSYRPYYVPVIVTAFLNTSTGTEGNTTRETGGTLQQEAVGCDDVSESESVCSEESVCSNDKKEESNKEDFSRENTSPQRNNNKEDIVDKIGNRTKLKNRANPRTRTHFTERQLKYLETYYSNGRYLSRDERTVLAQALEMTELQVRNWFQNRRYQRKQKQEREKAADGVALENDSTKAAKKIETT